MAYKRLALILGNCLFPNHQRLEPDKETLFFMAEDAGLCEHFKYHKHKLILFLSAMRSHADQISTDYDLKYWQLEEANRTLSYEDKLEATLGDHAGIDEIVTYDIEDHFFAARIRAFCDKHKLKLQIKDSPLFINSKADFGAYLNSVKSPFLHTYYQRQRKQWDILIDGDGEPKNGKWSFDDENRKKLPKKIEIPRILHSSHTKHTKDVIQLVDKLFSDHPGKAENFHWATTRDQGLSCLEQFLKERFESFGPYEDAIDKERSHLFHSVLSPYINMGLITAKEVIDQALSFAVKHNTHYPSVEGFVRQVLGWREFMRGIYHNFDDKMDANFFNHERRMKSCWYDGTTGVEPLDDCIKKVVENGYNHHIERLMVLGNIMLLCELHPDEVYKWFMEMYVDSSDWVMAPNVYGMSQFADGGVLATKPYIGGANYILKMSNYSKNGDWVDTVNGLYWRFIGENLEVFAKNQRMSMMVSLFNKMDKDKKARLLDKAGEFIERVTK